MLFRHPGETTWVVWQHKYAKYYVGTSRPSLAALTYFLSFNRNRLFVNRCARPCRTQLSLFKFCSTLAADAGLALKESRKLVPENHPPLDATLSDDG